jgi:hypothetical protein
MFRVVFDSFEDQLRAGGADVEVVDGKVRRQRGGLALAAATDAAARDACIRLSRNLTRDEWRTYFGSEPYGEPCPNLR